MSLDKAIKYGKDHRSEYYDSRSVDRSCRAHGGGLRYQCIHCLSNRQHKYVIAEQSAKEKETSFSDQSNAPMRWT